MGRFQMADNRLDIRQETEFNASPDAVFTALTRDVAIEMGAVAHDLSLTIHPHPTLSEMMKEAVLDAYGIATAGAVDYEADDVLGTMNFLDEAKRRQGAALVRRGAAFSLSMPFDTEGPQKGWRRRTNPVHTMTDTGTDAERGVQGFPHGIGGADDVIAMPLQCATQWDGLGHVFYEDYMWNGYDCREVTSAGAQKCGIEKTKSRMVGRGVFLDVAHTGEARCPYCGTVYKLKAGEQIDRPTEKIERERERLGVEVAARIEPCRLVARRRKVERTVGDGGELPRELRLRVVENAADRADTKPYT